MSNWEAIQTWADAHCQNRLYGKDSVLKTTQKNLEIKSNILKLITENQVLCC